MLEQLTRPGLAAVGALIFWFLASAFIDLSSAAILSGLVLLPTMAFNWTFHIETRLNDRKDAEGRGRP